MNSKEVIKKIVGHDSPPRIGLSFMGDNPKDILWVRTVHASHPERDRYLEWGRYPELLARVPGFEGEVKMTPMGNIFGRLNQKTGGECIKGALEDGWELLDSYAFPNVTKVIEEDYAECDKFVLSGLPCAIFASLRDIRRMDNALMDTELEQDNVRAFLDRVIDMYIPALDIAAKAGVNGIQIADDLGIQHTLFFSPKTFRQLLKPYYKRLADELHIRGMSFFVHSCGKVYDIIQDFIEAGVDVFQFDQPELSGSDKLAGNFGDRAAFYCPVDIQKIMPTGDRKVIEEGALNMVNQFKKHGGSLIAGDYGSWHDLNVLPEWQQWARDIIIANAAM